MTQDVERKINQAEWKILGDLAAKAMENKKNSTFDLCGYTLSSYLCGEVTFDSAKKEIQEAGQR